MSRFLSDALGTDLYCSHTKAMWRAASGNRGRVRVLPSGRPFRGHGLPTRSRRSTSRCRVSTQRRTALPLISQACRAGRPSPQAARRGARAMGAEQHMGWRRSAASDTTCAHDGWRAGRTWESPRPLQHHGDDVRIESRPRTHPCAIRRACNACEIHCGPGGADARRAGVVQTQTGPPASPL